VTRTCACPTNRTLAPLTLRAELAAHHEASFAWAMCAGSCAPRPRTRCTRRPRPVRRPLGVVYLTDARRSQRTFIADGFGPDWNPTR